MLLLPFLLFINFISIFYAKLVAKLVARKGFTKKGFEYLKFKADDFHHAAFPLFKFPSRNENKHFL